MKEMNWHEAKAITMEHLYGRYSHGDLGFAGLNINGVLDGVLHLAGFMPRPGTTADLFILFKEIRKITQHGQVTHPVFRYRVETVDAGQKTKRLTFDFDSGTTEIEYKDDLLYLCRLPNGKLIDL
jgi:hypothetical protein